MKHFSGIRCLGILILLKFVCVLLTGCGAQGQSSEQPQGQLQEQLSGQLPGQSPGRKEDPAVGRTE